MIKRSSRFSCISRMKPERESMASPVERGDLQAAQGAGMHRATQLERFDQQRRQLGAPRADVGAVPAGGKPCEQGFADLQAQTAARLPLRLPEFVSSFVAVDAGEPSVVEQIERL